MYSMDSEHDQGLADAEVLEWTKRTDINGTVSSGAAAVLAYTWAGRWSPCLERFVEAYKSTGNPLAGHSDTDVQKLVREIEERRRSVFGDPGYTEDEKDWNCTDLDAIQAYVEVVGGVRARV